MPAPRLTSAEFPFRLLPHQRAAIAAYESSPDPTRCHLVLPPGAGKTLIGAEIARRAGRRIVVLVPNSAIQGQWVQQWHLLGTDVVSVAEDRTLTADVTVLTYQAVATFADQDPSDADQVDVNDDPTQVSRLHPDAADFLRRLRVGPPFTLILDEAHHLAATWGELLDEILTEITTDSQGTGRSAPIVIALTATPRERLTLDQMELTDRLFGPQLFSASTPALVREQVLAPFRELVRFVNPTESERGYLRQSSTRWRELISGIADPDFASVSFIEFLNRHWIHRMSELSGGSSGAEETVSWHSVERSHPEIARALLRVHFDSQMVDLPQGARLREEHRQPPAVEDWVALISDYGQRALAASASEQDIRAWEQLRTALRSVGWTLTRRGARRGQSSVDRVLMRSAAKADAAASILQHEHALRDSAMRAVIITDHEYAASTPSARPTQALGPTAGSAHEALMQADQALPETRPVLITGRTVAGSTATIARLTEFIANGNPKLADGLSATPLPQANELMSLSGPGWRPRVWIPLVTGWFLAGGTRVLVGTRGLLGEGWDAASLNVLVDLTAATTTTAVVQIRGRAIRKDPADPHKAAHIWSVVVVSDDHPRGDLDYRRFAAKHEGFHAADAAGRIVIGTPHVDPECGPFSPPNPKLRTAVNIRMMNAANRTAELPLLWGVGQPYQDVDAPVVEIRGRDGGAPDLDVPQAAIRPWSRTRGVVPAVGAAVGAALPIIAAAPPGQALVWASIGGVAGWGADAGSRWAARRRTVNRTSPGDTLLAIGMAVAQGMNLDPALVDVAPDGEGVWRAGYSGCEESSDSGFDRLGRLHDPDQDSFASAMEQVISPVDWPRYLVSRRLPQRKAEIWHAVPDCLGKNRDAADGFHRAWEEFVSDARLVYANSTEGAGILAAVRGLNPGDVSAAMRVEWN